ncbi:type IV pilus biogenesis/stability protein PilW [Aquimonas sp.]|uniref:tetratricopeptide repeat protein n=1 Tax=Aquimonas sp. TaxID=1872588 RepID=UPI0037BE3758
MPCALPTPFAPASTTRAVCRLVWLLGMLMVLPLAAQDLPPLDARYDQADPAARWVQRVDIDNATERAALDTSLRREGRNPVLRLQSAWMHADRGMRQRIERDAEAALRLSEEGSLTRRMVHYNYGWIRFHLGEFELAKAQWLQAYALHGGQPDWVPSHFALLLWSQGDRETALTYYAKAAESQPTQWGREADLDAATADFGPNERLAMQSMHEAWLRDAP